jgi:protein-S-isoprenylcysteine O-methyltransferase Ste14
VVGHAWLDDDSLAPAWSRNPMYRFLVPLTLGFLLHIASAFTAAYSRRWGERGGQRITLLMRGIFGIPLWAVGLVLAVRIPEEALFRPPAAMRVLASILVVAGSAVVVWALWALRWRAAAPSVRDALVQHGPYAHVRHPIHGGTVLEFAGLACLFPTKPVLLACGLGFGWIHVQSRLEEIDLLQRLPVYRDYMERLPRFVPRLRRARPGR